MERIAQSATIRVPLQAYLASDHISPATGKTIAITISKNGAAYGNPSVGATNATEIANGSYYVDLSATDTGTLGPLFVRGAVATVDDVIAIYDVVSATGGLLDVNTKTITAGIIAAATFAANALDAVWSTAARTLTAGTNIVLAKGVGLTGLNDLSQADVRTAVGLGSANLDTQLAALPTAVQNADALLNRDMSVGTDSGSTTFRTPRQALRFLRNKWTIAGTALTVFKEDDTATSWTGVVSTDAAAVPIIGNDPAG